jgi:hypothetical protein
VTLAVGLATPAMAQLPAERIGQLLSETEVARQAIGKQPFPSLQTEAQNVLKGIDGVVQYLTPRTNPENLAKWLSFLQTEPLAQAIERGADREELAVRARAVRSRLIGAHDGLELAAMTTLRSHTDALLASLRFEDEPGSIKLVEQQAEGLTNRLRQVDPIPSAEDTAAIAGIVNLLDQSRQVPGLVAEVRTAFSQPNFVLTVDGQVIEQAVRRPVDQDRDVRDCILGTTVIGRGRLQGTVEGRLMPSRGRVQMDLNLVGQFHSDTIGYNGPVRLPTIGRGQATASRSVWIDENGALLSPTVSSACVDSTITSIQHPLRIVRHIAAKQIAQKEPQAERIAGERLRSQVARDFDKQTSEVANSRGQAVAVAERLGKARSMLTRFDLSEPTRVIGSTSNSVYLEAIQREANQLSACNPPPDWTLLRGQGLRPAAESGANPSATIQVHESLVDNVATRMLAGRTLTGGEIDELLTLTGRPRPANTVQATAEGPDEQEEGNEGAGEPMAAEESEGSFEIDFSTFRPIICELRDQTIRIGLRGTRFKQGERELKRALEITSTYQPALTEQGEVLLLRAGDVAVDFPGARRLTVQQVAVRRSIQRAFAGRFPETLLDRPLAAPANWQSPAVRGRIFKPALIDARDGWLSIGVR